MRVVDSIKGKVKDQIVSLPQKAVKNLLESARSKNDAQQVMQADAERVMREEAARDQQYSDRMRQVAAEHENRIRQAQQANANREILRRRAELATMQKENQALREQALNRVKNESKFSWRNVKDFLNKYDKTLQEALTMAGCPEHCELALTYADNNGLSATFIRLDDIDCDSVATDVRMNLKMKQYLETKNACVMAIGLPDRSSYSICYLIYDKEFGFVMLKNDRFPKTYPMETGDRLVHIGRLAEKVGFMQVALSDTFIKLAGAAAICINITDPKRHYIETKEDFQELQQMYNFNTVAYNRLVNAVEFFGINLGLKRR